jgi:hypothetical protein
MRQTPTAIMNDMIMYAKQWSIFRAVGSQAEIAVPLSEALAESRG